MRSRSSVARSRETRRQSSSLGLGGTVMAQTRGSPRCQAISVRSSVSPSIASVLARRWRRGTEIDAGSTTWLSWQPPFMPAAVANGSAESLASRLEAEILLLQGAHRRWMAQHGRSSVGLSGFAIGDCARYVADWLRDKAPPSPRDGFSAPLILRFAVDDLKAYGLEAAGAGAAKPSSRQLTDWFWNETATGAAIHVLREVLQAHEDERLRLIVSTFVVPAARVRGG